MAAPKTFEEASALNQTSPHTYEADFPYEWCIGSVPQGGFITGCFLAVASLHSTTTLSAQNQPHTIALHLDFLRRTQVGPALFNVTDVKLGRQTTIIRISLVQDTREEVTGTLTLSSIPHETGPTLPTTWSLSPPPPPATMSLLSKNEDPNWVRQPEMPFASFRRATQRLEFYFPRAGQPSRTLSHEWIRLSSPSARWTNTSIGFASDMWPMPVEASIYPHNPYSLTSSSSPEAIANAAAKVMKYWYPTLLLNLDIKKALPEEGVEWLFVQTHSKVIKNGRMDLEVVIMDEGMEVVAISNHIAFAVPAERNVAERVTGAKSKI